MNSTLTAVLLWVPVQIQGGIWEPVAPGQLAVKQTPRYEKSSLGSVLPKSEKQTAGREDCYRRINGDISYSLACENRK